MESPGRSANVAKTCPKPAGGSETLRGWTAWSIHKWAGAVGSIQTQIWVHERPNPTKCGYRVSTRRSSPWGLPQGFKEISRSLQWAEAAVFLFDPSCFPAGPEAYDLLGQWIRPPLVLRIYGEWLIVVIDTMTDHYHWWSTQAPQIHGQLTIDSESTKDEPLLVGGNSNYYNAW